MNPDSKLLGVIEPIRFLPFDIGCEIDDSIKQKIQIELNQNFQLIAEDGNVVRLLKTNSEYFLFGYRVSETIDLYIYRYGIAVFVIRGEIYSITDGNYATDYCSNRKYKHASYLASENKNTPILKKIAARLRNIVQAVCFNLRRSAREDWEFGGFSYVMTISIITKTDGNLVYGEMDDIDKANLQIMLEPSLANKEDSLIFSCYKESVDDICQIDLKNLNPPKNLLNSANRSIYISWAAVLFYTEEPDKSIEQMLTALEIDLQAMWMNVYCMYDNLVKGTTARKMKVSKLRQKLFSF